MDLKRMALGLHRKSYSVADKFFVEAMKGKCEIDSSTLLPYMQKILGNIEQLANKDENQKAEDALMYSTRILNYILYI